MFRLVYSSSTKEAFSPKALSALVSSARVRNARAGITGLLMYHDCRFLQVIEGERHYVEECFDRIRRDNRHEDVDVLSSSEAASKFFTDWFLAYESLDHLPLTGRDQTITLQQLHDRLQDLRDVETSPGRTNVMRRLRAYLCTVARYRSQVT